MPPQLFATILGSVIVAAGVTILAVWLLPMPWALTALALAALIGKLALMLLRR